MLSWIGFARRRHGEQSVNEANARVWHPWLRINRVLRVMLHTRWSAEDWPPACARERAGTSIAARLDQAVERFAHTMASSCEIGAPRREKKSESPTPPEHRILPMELRL